MAHIVAGLGVASLLLSVVVWIDAQRIKRRAARLIAWHEQQQHTVACGGMVISVEVNPQPTPDHLHLLTTERIGAHRGLPRGRSPNLN